MARKPAKKASKKPTKSKSSKSAAKTARGKKLKAKMPAAAKKLAPKKATARPKAKKAAPKPKPKMMVPPAPPAMEPAPPPPAQAAEPAPEEPAKPRTVIPVGADAPNFTLPTDGGGTLSLSELRGRPVVLYFYPRDDTPGCTVEACSFRDHMPDFSGINAAVIGVSTDSAASHDRFKAKYSLPFTLAADENHAVAEAYGVWVEKNRYGRKYMGTERSTFLIDAQGKVAKVWHNVKVEGHAHEVLAAARGQ